MVENLPSDDVNNDDVTDDDVNTDEVTDDDVNNDEGRLFSGFLYVVILTAVISVLL